jgi:hypothetical protein
MPLKKRQASEDMNKQGPIIKYIIIFIIVSCAPINTLAQDDRDLIKKKIKSVEENYRDGKKQQDDGFKKNLWKREDRDYVENWINSDISHLQLSIKYKKEYLAWVKKRKEEGKSIEIDQYLKTRNLDPIELKIVSLIHDDITKEKAVKEPELILDGKSPMKSLPPEKTSPVKKFVSIPENIMTGGVAANTVHGATCLFLFLCILFIMACVMFILYKKKRGDAE